MHTEYTIFADIGNSKTKVAVIAGNSERWSQEQVVDRPAELELDGCRPAVWNLISVNNSRCQELLTWIGQTRIGEPTTLMTRHHFRMPLKVQFPDRLGCDRLAAAYGAWDLQGRTGPLIIVSVGTAVTIDLVGETGAFEGGVIFPGPFASFQSLHRTTELLPELFSAEIPPSVLGRSTQAAIVSGVWQMQVGGIRHIVAQIKSSLDSTNIPIYLSGGGAVPLKKAFADEMRFVDNLVLHGMRAAVANRADP